MRYTVCLALFLIFGTCNPLLAAENVFGKWAVSEEICMLPDGEGDTVTISATKIFGLEWHCYVSGKEERKGSIIVDADCGAEGEEFKTKITYQLHGSHLLFKFGSRKKQALVSCKGL